MPADDREKVLAVLKDSVVDFCKKRNGEITETKDPRDYNTGAATARFVEIRFRDPTLALDPRASDVHTCFAYLLYGPKFTITCFVEYPEKFAADCRPLIGKIIRSIRALP